MADDSVSDIAFIGSGIACTVSLTELFGQILNQRSERIYHITVIEQYPELWKGIPYGSRSSVNALTINTVNDFFTNEEQGKQFFDWFIANQENIITDYLLRGANTASKWIQQNKAALGGHQWNSIYFPRYIIGIYLEQQFRRSLDAVIEKGFVKLSLIKGEVAGLNKAPGGYHINIAESNTPVVAAKKIVVAIGSAPERDLFAAVNTASSLLAINKVYAPSMSENLIKIKTKAFKDETINILLIGSNASAIELLYLIANDESLLGAINSITVLSTSGRLPSHITYTHSKASVCKHLEQLEGATYTIETLVAAAAKDIMQMPDNEVSVPDIDNIISYVLKLLKPLDDNARRKFYAVYGVQLARLFRRSGTDYKMATDKLIKAGKLNFLKGKFSAVASNGSKAVLTYFPDREDVAVKFNRQFDVIINCTGSADLEQSDSPLIQSLLKENSCRVNNSKKAFEVDEKLQAAPDIYIAGPLAGGNYNSLLSFWHLENASRIMYLAPYLARELLTG